MTTSIIDSVVLAAKDKSDGYIVSWCLEGHPDEEGWRNDFLGYEILRLTIDEAVEWMELHAEDRVLQ
jgi:hypothetical protein